ncbi:hypothetical protein INT48_009648 [Thamnidium elegans]|uniref:Uncharacterized protein n=1 Tax=Thamnidium elegans TaxID=101142 RepID=A0A8H7VY80_9FUNG|nr:hypothetical protein INT48_009648 [Thamnidium elegans]
MSSILRRICACCYKTSVNDESELTAGRQELSGQEQVRTIAWKSSISSPVDMRGVATCDSVVKKPDDIEQPGLRTAAWIGTSEGTQTGEDEGSAPAASGWEPTQAQIKEERDKEDLPYPWEEVYAKGFVPFDGKTIGPSWRELPVQNVLPDEPEQSSVKVQHDTGSVQGQRTADTDSLQVQRDTGSVQGQHAVDTASESQMSSKGETAIAQDKLRSDSPTATTGDAEVKTADVKETPIEQKKEQTPEQAKIQEKKRVKEQAAAIKLTTE